MTPSPTLAWRWRRWGVSDIVERLRIATIMGMVGGDPVSRDMLRDAAAEIERLREIIGRVHERLGEIKRLREERPKVRVPLADLSGGVSRDRVIDALRDAGVEVEE